MSINFIKKDITVAISIFITSSLEKNLLMILLSVNNGY